KQHLTDLLYVFTFKSCIGGSFYFQPPVLRRFQPIKKLKIWVVMVSLPPVAEQVVTNHQSRKRGIVKTTNLMVVQQENKLRLFGLSCKLKPISYNLKAHVRFERKRSLFLS